MDGPAPCASMVCGAAVPVWMLYWTSVAAEGAVQWSGAEVQRVPAQRLEHDGRLPCPRLPHRHLHHAVGRVQYSHLRHPPSLSAAAHAAPTPVCFVLIFLSTFTTLNIASLSPF